MIIGAIGGGLILWVWQFVSFAALNLHDSQMAHTDKQDAIIEALTASGIEEGEYMIPRLPNSASSEEMEAFGEKQMGKPWALVKYRNAMSMSMGMNMARSLIINILAAFLLCWLLLQMSDLDMKKSVMASIFIGLMGYFTVTYLDSIWFEGNTIPYLLDAIVSWGITGAFLGWWLNR